MSNSNRRPNHNFGNRNYGSSSRNSTLNLNRSRRSGGDNFSNNNTRNQVSPWLSSNSLLGSALGRNLPNEHLELATRLLNNLLSPDLANLTQPRPLLGIGRTTNTAPFTNDSLGFNRNHFGQGRPNSGGEQKNFKRDFKNKHFGNDRNSKKKDQSQNNKKATDEKIAEKKEVISNEGVKIEKMDIEQYASEESDDVKVDIDSIKTDIEQKKKETKSSPEPKINYDNIPAALLFCHICRKHMWDDTSFKKHLEGRPHMLMMEELDQSYKMKVELLRHEMRVMELQRENDIKRSQRKGKGNLLSQQRDFCTMCNLNFLGTLPIHRKNERHQKLKKFLHPKCNICSEEFYTRLELDDHKLSPGHLKKLAEIRNERRPELEDSEFDIIDFIEEINDALDVEDIELKVVGKRETLALQSGKTAGSQDEDNDREGNVGDEDQKALPKFNAGIPVGEDFVSEIKGSLCRVCHKFLMTPDDVKIHCQTAVHYNNTVRILKMQNNFNRKRRVNKIKAEKEEATVDGDSISEERSCKRPKIESSVENVSTNEIRTTELNDDKYDPELSEDDENETNTAVFDSEKKPITENENNIQNVSVVIDKLINGTGAIHEVDIKVEYDLEKVEAEGPVAVESKGDEKSGVDEPTKVEEKQAKALQSVKTDKQTRSSPRAQRARRGRGRRF